MNTRSLIKNLVPRSILLDGKWLYQWLYRIRNGKKIIETQLRYSVIADEGYNCFFGYYDISPFNTHNDLLYIKTKADEPYADIMLLEHKTGKKHKLARTGTWNWQQGCRLRWMPGSDENIFYNDFNGSSYLGVVKNIKTGEEFHTVRPIYDISPDGKYGLSLNFERLGVMRPGYGYTNKTYAPSMLQSEGISLVDLIGGTVREVLTYTDIAKSLNSENLDFSNNYLNHISYSPSGNSFLFFWLTIVNGYHKACLMVYDFVSKVIIPLETDGKVSHYSWLDDDEILCTTYDLNYKCRYYIYKVSDRSKILVASDAFNEDGHPSVYSEKEIITDTYPNSRGYQSVSLVNRMTGEYKRLFSLYSNCTIEGERRTDLHPRLNSDKSLLCIDSNTGKLRSLIVIEL